MSDVKTSQVIKQEAERCYREASAHLQRAEARREPLSALAAQTSFNFARVFDALSVLSKDQEEIMERCKHLERAMLRAGHADQP